MSYFAVCTFDLKDASHDDYQTAYADLSRLGLYKHVTSSQGNKVNLPTTTTAGEFDGNSAKEVKDDLTERVKQSFKTRRFKSEIFVSVGGDWSWRHSTT